MDTPSSSEYRGYPIAYDPITVAGAAHAAADLSRFAILGLVGGRRQPVNYARTVKEAWRKIDEIIERRLNTPTRR